jgi:hypothetical protein
MMDVERLAYYFDSLSEITLPVLKILGQLIYGKKITGVVKQYCLPNLDCVIPATMAFMDK